MTKTSGHGIPGWADAATEPAWQESEPDTSVAARFERVVAAAPEAIAFCTPAGETIGYGELNARANRLAHLIRGRLQDPEAPVGLLARHPAHAITGMLGSLKSGHVYTPLDPADPPGRLEHILEDSTAELIVTAPEHTSMAERLAGDRGDVVVIGRDDRDLADTDLDVVSGLDQPAYLLYTSGSTGVPKGVLHSHRNLLHKGEVQRTFFGMGPGDRVSLLFGPATGAATSGIYGPLLNGGTVCPYDLKMHGLQNLGRWLHDRDITVLHMVPTVFRRFLDLGDEDASYPNVRLLILPGEPTYHRDVELYRRHFGPDTVLAPRLSSAESSVVAVDYLRIGSDVDSDILPVGFPLSDKEVRLVDETGREVAPGTIGQIEVESEYLALGYWRNAELTREKFGDGRNGRRVYRMGDLGRFRADGRLEFIGRVDDRLKINGVTIEPREVERAMHQVGRFKEVAVVGMAGPDGGDRLTAYVVLEDGAELPADFRASLAELLPAPMIPASTVVLDALPLTSLGKVDKRSLPRPEVEPTRSVPPRDDLEASLVSIWSQVLKIEGLGVTDDFFELGGTSIQALQAFALIGKRLRVDVPSTTLLQAPTVAALAEVIRMGSWEPTQGSLIPVVGEGEATPYFCVHGGGGGVFFVRDLAAHLDGNRPIYGLQARGFEGRPGPYRPVEELAANYIEEVRSVQPSGPYLLGGLSFGGKVAFEMAQQLVASGEEVALVAMLDAQAVASAHGTDPGRHRDRMESMTLVGKGGYVVRGLGKRAIRALKRGLIRYHLTRNEPLPDTLGLRNLYFYPMHSKANREYLPGDYPGRVAMIAAKEKKEVHEDTWGRVALGGFDVVEVATPHAGLTEEPYVIEVAAHLQRFLDEADPAVVGNQVRA